jgi:hypothetical protein
MSTGIIAVIVVAVIVVAALVTGGNRQHRE